MKKHYFKLMLLVLAIFASIGQMYGWNNVYLIGDDLSNWSSNRDWYQISSDGTGSGYFYLTKNNYFATYLYGYNEKAGPSSNGEEVSDGGTKTRFYIWGDGENSNAAKYVGNSGIVEVHCDQKTGNNDDKPQIWITRPTIYIRHNWNSQGWSNQTMTDNHDGTYSFRGNYDVSSGCNIGPCSSCTDGNNSFKYLSAPDHTYGTINDNDKCLFIYNASGYR